MTIALVGAALALGAACSQAPVAPGHGWLAFTQAGQLMVTDPGGDALRALGPIDPGSRPAWSLNGQIIAFARNGTVWTTRADGTSAEFAFASPAEGSALVWAPNDRLLAYTARDGGRIELLDIVTGAVTPAYREGVQVDGWWRPRDLEPETFVARATATRGVALVDAGALTERVVLEADWTAPAPADDRVAVGDGSTLRIWTPFSDQEIALAGASTPMAASWSPDGRLLAVTVGTEDAAEVQIVNVADSTEVALGPGARPSWRDDGAAVALERGAEVVVVVVDLADGTERWSIEGAAPAWQPELRSEFSSRAPAAVEIEPRNLIDGSRSFELGSDGWLPTGDSPPTAALVTTDSARGGAAAEVQFTGVNSVFAVSLAAQKETLDGTALTFSAWVRAADACVHLVHAGDGVTLLAGVDQSEPHPGDGEWHRMSLSFSPAYDTTAVTTFIDLGVRCDGTAIALVDGAQLEFGSEPTAFEAQETDALSVLPRGQPVVLP